MSRMLSSSSEMRSAGPRERRPEPEPVVPVRNEPEPFSFGSDLEKVLLAHKEAPAAVPLPAPQMPVAQIAKETPAEPISFPTGDPLSAEEKAEVSSTPTTPVATTVSVDVVARDYQGLVEAAHQVFDAAAKGTEPDSGPIIAAVKLAFKLFVDGDELLAEMVRHRRDFRAWPERSANVAIFAMRLGLEMKLDERKCLALGLCGLMHDVGMLKIPPEVLESSGLNAKQLEMLRHHPIESQKIIEGFGASFAWIGKIVVQAHERQDGSGYPHALKGKQLHEIAAILGLADSYEAMAHPRPDRKAQPIYNTLKQIIDQNNTQFERPLIKALLSVVSIFPLGSLVQLNNGAIGRVIGTHSLHPTRPTLEIRIDSRGQLQAGMRLLDLQSEPLLNIVDPAIEETVLEQ
jgi:uncharacterized protein YwbE